MPPILFARNSLYLGSKTESKLPLSKGNYYKASSYTKIRYSYFFSCCYGGLEQQSQLGHIDLFYGDETGVSESGYVPLWLAAKR
jgi:hypothetical protein